MEKENGAFHPNLPPYFASSHAPLNTSYIYLTCVPPSLVCDYFSLYFLAKKVFRSNSATHYHPQGVPVIGQGLLEKEVYYSSATPDTKLTRRSSIAEIQELKLTSSSPTSAGSTDESATTPSSAPDPIFLSSQDWKMLELGLSHVLNEITMLYKDDFKPASLHYYK